MDKLLLLTESDLAEALQISVRTLQGFRASGIGPAFIRVGGLIRGNVRYEQKAVEEWLASRSIRSTSEKPYITPRRKRLASRGRRA